MGIKEELVALKDEKGFIICETAVQWAKDNPGSHLHSALEWNDRRAGQQFRLQQVRHLIAVHIVYETGERKFVSLSIDRTENRGGYRDLDDILPKKTLREILLADALKELDRVQIKYSRLEELAGIWDAVEKVKKRKRAA